MKPREEMAALVQLDSNSMLWYDKGLIGIGDTTIDTTCITSTLDNEIRKLEMRIECLENQLKNKQKQESKYVIVLGE